MEMPVTAYSVGRGIVGAAEPIVELAAMLEMVAWWSGHPAYQYGASVVLAGALVRVLGGGQVDAEALGAALYAEDPAVAASLWGAISRARGDAEDKADRLRDGEEEA